MSKTITCPSCDGEKGGMALVNFGAQGCQQMWMGCSQCKGEGVIPEEMLSWMARGEKMREDRFSRDLSLREEAKRLGISVVEYSQMEYGRIEPIDYGYERERLGKISGGR